MRTKGGICRDTEEMCIRDRDKEDVVVYAVGKKGKDTLERNGYHIAADYSEVMDEPSYHDAMHIGRRVLEAFEKGEIGEIYLAYTCLLYTSRCV